MRAPARFLSAIVLAASTASADPRCGSSDQADCALGDHPFFDERAFGDAVADALGAGFPGYAAVLIDARGDVVARVARGEATKAADPEGSQRFGTFDTKSRLGSVSKIVTVATALRLIEERAEAGVAISPRTRIADVAPDFIADNLAARYADVRLADLMDHTAGMPRDFGGQRFWQIANGQPQDGQSLPTVGGRSYSNVGVSLLGFLLPFIADPDLEATFAPFENPLICGGTPSCIENAVRDVVLARYETLAKALILEPAGIEGDCSLSAFAGDDTLTIARGYTGTGASQGTLAEDLGWMCPAGGWVMTAMEVARLGHALGRDTNRLMSAQTYALMEAPSPTALGWNPPVGSLASGAPLFDRVFTHGGLINWTSGGVSGSWGARLVRLPNGMSAAALTNAPDPMGGSRSVSLRDALIEGYEAGVAGEAAQVASTATTILFP